LKKKELEMENIHKSLKESNEQRVEESLKSINVYKEKMESIQNELDEFRKQTTTSIISVLRELTEKEEASRYQKLLQDNLKIGCITTRRDGHVINEFWEDGEEFKVLKSRQEGIKAERDVLDSMKKSLTKLRANLGKR
jgi:anion-transporting  ArsA/GET3 family ATPase